MSAWNRAAARRGMNPSIIREILKLTEQPGVRLDGRRAAVARNLSGRGDARGHATRAARRAARGAAIRRQRRLRRRCASGSPTHLRAAGHGVDAVAGADHHRLAAGSGPGRQGADRRRQPRRGRGAHLPRRPAGLHALRAESCRGLRRRGPLPDGASARRAGARFLYVLPNFQNPTGRCSAPRAAPALVRGRARAGLPLVEDNPYGDLWFDEPPPPPLARAGPRACSTSARSRRCWRPGLRLGYLVAPRGARTRSCCRPSRPPTCTRPASTSASCTRWCATASSTARADASARATAQRDAMRRRARAALGRQAPPGMCRRAACSSGSACPRAGRPGAAAEGGRGRRGLSCRVQPFYAQARRCRARCA